jgi:hypothetical protein
VHLVPWHGCASNERQHGQTVSQLVQLAFHDLLCEFLVAFARI